MDLATDDSGQMPTEPVDAPVAMGEPTTASETGEDPESTRRLAARIIDTIKKDRAHHDKAFKRMRDDMFVATHGREPSYPSSSYKAPIAGRHVKVKTAALYAKNPKAVARRAERLDFAVWDEDPQSLTLATQVIQMATQAAAMAQQAGPQLDPITGAAVPAQVQMPPGFEQAQAVLADFQQGMERRKMIDRVGKTLEILFGHAQREQKPVDFKTGMKQLVRRTCTTGVGYVELSFQREYGPRPAVTEQMADAKQRLDHLRRLTEEAASGEIESSDAEMAELEKSLAALQAEEEIVIREGLVVDFPRATKVIPDSLCKTLVGFIGSRHLTLEYEYSCDEIVEMFGVDLQGKYTGYTPNGSTEDTGASPNEVQDDRDPEMKTTPGKGLVRVWKYYDKPSGLVYYVADGYPGFLREPAAPDVFVEDFWPIYAVTFNEVENENELFPPSDVWLIRDMQNEYNRSRQGMREHRQAARPRWTYANGTIDDDDVERLKSMKPFEAIGLNVDPAVKMGDVFQAVPVPGVDPNLYETGQLFTDIQLVVGTQEAQFGGVAKATATESAIAANSSASSDGSSIDDLDAFLTVIARASGQILLREMSEEQVKTIVGPGAVWPHLSLAEIASEIYLEVEAGSSGKPNQAVEIANLERMMPFLIQLKGLNQDRLAKEVVRRLDDKIDLTEMLSPGADSLVALNGQKQPSPGDPAADPNSQGPQGAKNGPQPPPESSGGSDAAFGSNQV